VAEADIITLYRQYADRLKRYVRLHVRNPEEVDDIIQNVFLELCKPKTLRQVNKDAGAYLFGTARHLVARHLRQKQKERPIPWEESLQSLPLPRSVDSAASNVRRIQSLLKQLSPTAREALRLRYLDEMSCKEAAARTGCSEHAFHMRLHRAICGLRGLVPDGHGSCEPSLKEDSTEDSNRL
jgi:RNA polymerase sigma factor (sigma-70 family)